MSVKVHYLGQHEFELIEKESPPSLSSDEVLVEPLRVGICGSDLFHMEEDTGDIEVGHEWIGQVQSIGKNVENLKTGDLVTSSAFLSCGKCHQCQIGDSNYCINGTMLGSKEKSVLQSWEIFHESDLIALPKSTNIDHAPLLEVAAVGDEAAAKLQGLSPESKSVLVFGAGPIGTFTALALKRRGFDPYIVDKVSVRLQVAEALGLKTYSFGMLIMKQQFFNSFSNVIDCSGESPNSQGALNFIPRFITPKARIVIVGKYHSISPQVFSDFSELTPQLTWLRGVSKKAFIKSIHKWVPDIDKIAELINLQSFPLSKINEAFEFAKTRSSCLKTMILVNDYLRDHCHKR